MDWRRFALEAWMMVGFGFIMQWVDGLTPHAQALTRFAHSLLGNRLKGLNGFCVLVGFAVLSAPGFAQQLIWKTEPEALKELHIPNEQPGQSNEGHGDFVAYVFVSPYGRTFYLTYVDSARAYVSFDVPWHVDWNAQLSFATEQITAGAFDWGGVMEGNKFKPLYVIKRFLDPGFNWAETPVNKAKSGLFVWHLSDVQGQGLSEMIGLAGPVNAKARLLAERHHMELLKQRNLSLEGVGAAPF